MLLPGGKRKMKIIGFVPVRCGSKSIPMKNIRKFFGKPLVYWCLNALQNSNKIDEIIVATDCEQIKTTVLNFNFSKVSVYNREKENAADHSSTESVILEFLAKNNYRKKDLFVLVQATSPFIQLYDIDKSIKQYISEKADSLISCVRTKRFFWNKKGFSINYDYKNRPRRQDFEGIFMENGMLYINKVGNIARDKNRLSGKISIYEMPYYTSLELDQEEDWIQGELIMKKYFYKPLLQKIKLLITDVDGVLTDAGMYYTELGDEIKKFNTQDGKAFEILNKSGIKTAILTSEKTQLVERRAKKIRVDYLYQDVKDKLNVAKEICKKENITLSDVAFIGDDLNDLELLLNVQVAAIPKNAVNKLQEIPTFIHLSKSGGEGVVREFVDEYII